MKIWKDRHGSGAIPACVAVILISMLISMFWLYASIVNKAMGNMTYVRQKLDAYMTGYMMEHTELLIPGDGANGPVDSTELTRGAVSYLGIKSGENELVMSNGVRMEDITSEFISGDQFGVKLTYTLTIPFRFLGQDDEGVRTRITVKSRAVPIR